MSLKSNIQKEYVKEAIIVFKILSNSDSYSLHSVEPKHCKSKEYFK